MPAVIAGGRWLPDVEHMHGGGVTALVRANGWLELREDREAGRWLATNRPAENRP